MKLKYKVRQIADGRWAVWKNKTRYFKRMIFETKAEATQVALLEEGRDIIEKLDDVQKRMESIPGMINERDPYGWRA